MNEIEKLKQENAELKAKIKKYAELNEIDTRDYAALHNENIKLNAIIDSYQPKIQALKVEIAELQAYKDVNEDFKTAWEELKTENERLKEENVKLLFGKGTLVEFCNKLTQIIDEKKESENKLLQTLQEIKEIAEKYLTDCQGFKCDAMEEILQKITKAEEE